MLHPKVTIIVPVYNGKDYIKTCIDSITQGDLREIEIIVVNDASTDNTLQIVQELQNIDERIKIISLSENHRQGGARNFGIRAAASDLIAFVDADDWVDKSTYLKAYNLLNENNDDIVAFNLINYFSESDQQIESKYDKSTEYLGQKRFILSSPAPWQALFKKTLFLEGFMFPEKTFYEDAAIMPAIFLKAKKIEIINEGLYYYRRNNNSTCRRRNDYRYFERANAMEIFYNNMKSLNLIEKFNEEIEYQYLKVAWIDSIIGAIYNYDIFPRKYLSEIFNQVNKSFPNYIQNKYLKNEGLKRRLLIKTFDLNFNIGCLVSNILSKLHKK